MRGAAAGAQVRRARGRGGGGGGGGWWRWRSPPRGLWSSAAVGGGRGLGLLVARLCGSCVLSEVQTRPGGWETGLIQAGSAALQPAGGRRVPQRPWLVATGSPGRAVVRGGLSSAHERIRQGWLRPSSPKSVKSHLEPQKRPRRSRCRRGRSPAGGGRPGGGQWGLGRGRRERWFALLL